MLSFQIQQISSFFGLHEAHNGCLALNASLCVHFLKGLSGLLVGDQRCPGRVLVIGVCGSAPVYTLPLDVENQEWRVL